MRIRQLVIMIGIALLIEIILIGWFTRIPDARAFIPLQVTDSVDTYNWTPDTAPRWFHIDDPSIPEASYFQEALPTLDPNDPFLSELIIMNWVRDQALIIDAPQALPGDPISVHQAMQTGQPAQCGNFATLLATSSASVGLVNIRTWHLLAHDGPGGNGHVANEIWSPKYNKWIFLDPMDNTYVLFGGEPASLFEVREMLLTGQESRLTLVVGKNSHTLESEIFDLYRQVMVVPSLDASHTPLRDFYGGGPLDQVLARLPAPVGSVIGLVTGESHQVILLDDLAHSKSVPLPIGQAKGVFYMILIDALLIGLLLIWLIVKISIHIRHPFTQPQPLAQQPG